MQQFASTILDLLASGAGNLAAYLAAHVLLCLLPAFFIAGAMAALIPKEMVTRYLGRNTPVFISYPAAAAAGFLLAVCSCTVIPLFAGIYKKGAGLGPAITFLFVAPAVNILALTYTGAVIGLDLALARLLLSILFGISVGLIMALIFRKSDVARDTADNDLFAGRSAMRPASLAFLLTLIALLVIGTFQVSLLKDAYFQMRLPITGAERAQEFLFTLMPFDPTRGEEGVTLQGTLLIFMLLLLAPTAWKGLNDIHSGFTTWTWLSLSLAGLTLLLASLSLTPTPSGLVVGFPGKFFGVLICLALLGFIMKYKLSRDELRDFLWESWRFIKQIFPLLITGVFVVGAVRSLIQPEWVQTMAGSNTLLGNFIGVVFGVFMYFPTLIEVPIAQMFLNLGMHRGPLLAYLISDPELSLQSILITASIIGKLKAWVYVGWVALFSTAAGLLYGAWVDGTNIWLIGLLILAFLSALLLIFKLANRLGLAGELIVDLGKNK
jgi:uncharacterized membrane protein YraQ (UPF0718 family)